MSILFYMVLLLLNLSCVNDDSGSGNEDQPRNETRYIDEYFLKLVDLYCSITFLSDTNITISHLEGDFNHTFKKGEKVLVSKELIDVNIFYRLSSGFIRLSFPMPDEKLIKSSCNLGFSGDTIGIAFEKTTLFTDPKFTEEACILEKGELIEMNGFGAFIIGEDSYMEVSNSRHPLKSGSAISCGETSYYPSKGVRFKNRDFPLHKVGIVREKE